MLGKQINTQFDMSRFADAEMPRKSAMLIISHAQNQTDLLTEGPVANTKLQVFPRCQLAHLRPSLF